MSTTNLLDLKNMNRHFVDKPEWNFEEGYINKFDATDNNKFSNCAYDAHLDCNYDVIKEVDIDEE